MPAKAERTIAERLTAAQLAINTTLADEEIQRLVSQYGYTPARIREGKRLCERAARAVNARKALAAAQREAALKVKAAKGAAEMAYQGLSQVARAALSHTPAQLNALGLAGKMPSSTTPLILAGYSLFDNVAGLPDLLGPLASFGYDTARLTAERASIAAFDAARQAQEAAAELARKATGDQESAMAALDEWMEHFARTAKVALRGKRDLQVKIGIASRAK